MKILLAGPGTGKTTNIQNIIKEMADQSQVLVISFTNATVDDLKRSLTPIGVSDNGCMTLHKFAVKYNHDKQRHVLAGEEIRELKQISERTEISFDDLCNFLSATTFDQMIERFVAFAKANPLYLTDKISGYKVLIVDEYQDFNKNEQDLIDLLVGYFDETYILGDDDQCIYDFKDASNDKIIALYQDGAHEKLQHEHKCYRCPDIVVDGATKLIQKNAKRVDKQWEKTAKDGSLSIEQFYTNAESNDHVVAEIKKICESGADEKILVLSPVGFFVGDLAQKLTDAEIDFNNYFVGKVPLELLFKAWELRVLFGQHRYLNLVLLGYKVLSSRNKFYELIKKHFDGGQNFDELHTLLLTKLPAEIKVEYADIDAALAVPYFESLAQYYADATGETPDEKIETLFVSMGESTEKQVSIMSIHKSKGLGAEHVFMIGLIEGIIPNKAQGNDSIEAQRRLFYVGMTRAKKCLHLLSSVRLEGKYVYQVNKKDFIYNARTKIYYGKSSRFIGEVQ